MSFAARLGFFRAICVTIVSPGNKQRLKEANYISNKFLTWLHNNSLAIHYGQPRLSRKGFFSRAV
jgi:hypothetical protein